MNKQILSIVVPVYYQEKGLNELYNRLKKVVMSISDEFDYEIIFVNDGSKDKSIDVLRELSEKDINVKVLNFSRNFGHQIAVTAGIDFSKGDIVVLIDDDLQDPPEIILEMLKKWKEGFQVVYGVRNKRQGENFFKIFTAKLFYRILGKLSYVKIPLDTGDFRLMDKVVVNYLKEMREENRFIRGMVSWVGFKQYGLLYNRDPRYAGKSQYNLTKLIKFAINGITGFSDKPLIFSSYFGFIITFASFIYGSVIIFLKIRYPDFIITGWSSLFVTTLFFGGIQLMSIGILGTYIGRIYNQIKKRPLYIVEEIIQKK
jgi:polyisoprenyl-phosphate glycosyltransferase